MKEKLRPMDIDFIAKALNQKKEIIKKLMEEENDRILILDNEQIFLEALFSSPEKNLSTFLYFYILLRRALVNRGVSNPKVAEYCAEVLERFLSSSFLKPIEYYKKRIIFLSRVISLIKDSEKKFFLILELANLCLFLTGVFPDYINDLFQIKDLEELGSECFKAVSTHPLTKEYVGEPEEVEEVFAFIGKEFKKIRESINHVINQITFRDIEI